MKVLIFSISICIVLILFSCNGSNNDQKATTDTTKPEKIKVENNGVAISYDDTQKGDTVLLFVHGWGINKSYWQDQADFFRSKYRVVAVDLPGFGSSGINRKIWTTEEYGKDISAVIARLKLKNVILIGHSMSGAVVVETALQNQDKVLGVIGIDNFKNVADEPTAESKKGTAEFYKEARKNLLKAIKPYFEEGLFSPTTDSVVKKRVWQDIAASDSVIALDCMEQSDNYPLTQKLASMKKTIYLVNSDFASTDTAAFTAKGISYKLYTIHDTGHYPMIEKVNEFNTLLQQAVEAILNK